MYWLRVQTVDTHVSFLTLERILSVFSQVSVMLDTGLFIDSIITMRVVPSISSFLGDFSIKIAYPVIYWHDCVISTCYSIYVLCYIYWCACWSTHLHLEWRQLDHNGWVFNSSHLFTFCVHLWWPEDNLWELVSSFYHVGARDQLQLAG